MGMISRLIARDSGIVDFHGKDIAKWKSKELSKKLAILTQSNQIQMKLTVRELVGFGRFPYSGGRLNKEDEDIVNRAIAYMELELLETDLLTNCPEDSGREPISLWLLLRIQSMSCLMNRPIIWISIMRQT